MAAARSRESWLTAYVEELTAALGHADRATPFRSYCVGLLLPGERKSVEPMAARAAPERVQAAHQSLRHFGAKADRSDEAVLAAVQARVLPLIEQQGPIRGWMIDDTGMPTKGTHSVGVVRQYCGQRGKQDNCPVAVTLSVAADHASLPIAHRLYLPQVWADDAQRCVCTGVPQDVAFQTKPQIAFAQIRAALAAGAGAARCRTQPVAAGRRLLPQKPWSSRGRRPLLLRRDDTHKPVSARQVAFDLPKRTWRGVTWREGSIAPLACRFAAVRVRPGHRDYWRSTPRPAEWLLIEWPAGEAEPTRY